MANYWIVWSAKDSNLNNDNILTAGDQDEVTCRTINKSVEAFNI